MENRKKFCELSKVERKSLYKNISSMMDGCNVGTIEFKIYEYILYMNDESRTKPYNMYTNNIFVTIKEVERYINILNGLTFNLLRYAVGKLGLPTVDFKISYNERHRINACTFIVDNITRVDARNTCTLINTSISSLLDDIGIYWPELEDYLKSIKIKFEECKSVRV